MIEVFAHEEKQVPGKKDLKAGRPHGQCMWNHLETLAEKGNGENLDGKNPPWSEWER